ncbi:MAG: RNA polymerase sigma-70 factor [Tannerella sp.]|jgi:RNA polymerase sigma-70 factor (ECF subfamily)|nr:RNA polymerase sigma-70 factor [Tannerella sp.]
MNDINDRLTAIDGLFRKYRKPLCAYAFRFLSNAEAAEDVVQEVFLELWKQNGNVRLEDAAEVKAYLFRSVYNRSINVLNSAYSRNHCALDGIDETLVHQDYLAAQGEDTEKSVLLAELENEIANSVDRLPQQCRNVFILSREKQMKNREIALALGITVKTVEKHIGKALAVLRNNLRVKELY